MYMALGGGGCRLRQPRTPEMFNDVWRNISRRHPSDQDGGCEGVSYIISIIRCIRHRSASAFIAYIYALENLVFLKCSH